MSRTNDVTLAEKQSVKGGLLRNCVPLQRKPIKQTYNTNNNNASQDSSNINKRSPNNGSIRNILIENDFSYIDDEDTGNNKRNTDQLQKIQEKRTEQHRDEQQHKDQPQSYSKIKIVVHRLSKDDQPIDLNNAESLESSTSSNPQKTNNITANRTGNIKLTSTGTSNKIINNNETIRSVTSDNSKTNTNSSSSGKLPLQQQLQPVTVRQNKCIQGDQRECIDQTHSGSGVGVVGGGSYDDHHQQHVDHHHHRRIGGFVVAKDQNSGNHNQVQSRRQQRDNSDAVQLCVDDRDVSCRRSDRHNQLNETVRAAVDNVTQVTIKRNERGMIPNGNGSGRNRRCSQEQQQQQHPIKTAPNSIKKSLQKENLKEQNQQTRLADDNAEKFTKENMFAANLVLAAKTNPIESAATSSSSSTTTAALRSVAPAAVAGSTSSKTTTTAAVSAATVLRIAPSVNATNLSNRATITSVSTPTKAATVAAVKKTIANATVAVSPTATITGDLDHDTKSQKMCRNSDVTKLFSDESSHQRDENVSTANNINDNDNNICSKGGKSCAENQSTSALGETTLFAGTTPASAIAITIGSTNNNNINNNNNNKNIVNRSSDKKSSGADGEASGKYCDLGPIGFNNEIGDIDDDDDDDPYMELEMYLEKVKREINEVFEQYKMANDELPRSMIVDSNTTNNKLVEQKTPCFLNDTNSDKKLNKISSSSREAERSASPKTATTMTTSATTATPITIKTKNNNNAAEVAASMETTTTNISTRLTDCDQKEEERDPSQGEPTEEDERRKEQQQKMASYRKSLASIKAHDSTDVNLWANTILKELDNLMGSDKRNCAKSVKDHVVSTNNEQNRTRSNILKPEKHTTIPLYSFNLDHPILETTGAFNSKKPPIDFNRKVTSVTSNNQGISNSTNSNNNNHISGNGKGQVVLNNMRQQQQPDTMTVLKIEEDTEGDAETIKRLTTASTTGPAQFTTKKEANQQTSLILNDAIKKGSTSTIWTSEESILRSVGAVDEDNKSTSSSACDEATGVLSSGKSGNSLDSSELDNENNESGIGTATPPKDTDSWKNLRPITTTRQNSIGGMVNSHPFHRIKYYKSNSIVSSDDPDLLEVLSQCDGANDDDDMINHDYDCFDCVDSKSTENDDDEVILRNRHYQNQSEVHRHAMSIPLNRAKKGRSHSIETGQFNTSARNDFELFEKLNDSGEFKTKRPFCLPLSQEPFQNCASSNIRELPSPSSASLHSGHGNLVLQELTTKSNSAPILLKKEKRKDDFGGQQNTLRYSRSQSDRYLAEIEAIEACKWLRAAGFPQYAQMYEDLQFPIDLSNVAKDHPILENDPLQSLYRRLCILNRCATMRLDSSHKQHGQQKKDDSDDEGCALSENWTFQRENRRWSRIGEMGLEIPTKQLQDMADCSSKDSSPDRFDDDNSSQNLTGFSSFPLNSSDSAHNETDPSVRFRRSGSERLKDGAKAFLRRVESIKSRRRKRQNREGLVISGPQMLDLTQINQKVTELKCIEVTAALSNPPSPMPMSPMHFPNRSQFMSNELKVPTEHGGSEKFLSPNRLSPKHIPTTPRSAQSMRSSPLHFFATTMPHLKEGKSDDSSSYYSDSQESSSGGRLVVMRRQPSRSKRFLQRSGKVDDIGALSDSECHQTTGRKMIFKDANSNNTEIKVTKLNRGGSLNLGKESKRYRDSFHSRSFRSRTSVRKNQKFSESDKEDSKPSKGPVVRWHSFQNHDRPHTIFKKCFSGKAEPQFEGTSFVAMSCGQLQVIRKLALVTLTGYMERYCPSHRSGWNWELPKFIKKIKTPDYKDKKVFGVPLLLVLQRTGQALPKAIRCALKWLQINALDQIGLFRKSGVKSRITKLKELLENSETDSMDIFDTQQAYDVADMLKQYFRDLPESLLTTKMSETFVAIFQHLPPEVRADAIQSAVLLLPDENREVLFALLEFLSHVADNSQFNQMTANNLSVCLAPSLFNNSIVTGRSNSVSPRRKKTAGVPDAKELSETRASHECLTFMIVNYEQIFTATREKMLRCNFGYMEESKPVPLEALGEGMQFHNWRGYLYECTSATIKEGREKSRGWVTTSSLDPNVEIAYKKVGDGHPLRLWRCLIEVEAPPAEVLNYILKERHIWDSTLLKSRTIQKLDERTELFQYVCDGPTMTDYCVLRAWQPDLPRGACVIVETSIEHPEASLLLGGVRGVVLASRYLIEPSGSGRSRVMHLSRIDAKGRTPEWYNKSYGHILSHYLTKIRSAFRHVADGPESKV